MDASDFFASQADKGGKVEDLWRSAADFHSRRLWHQLSRVLQRLVDSEDVTASTKVALYENAIAEFETKLKPLSLVLILVNVVEAVKDKEAFLLRLEDKVKADVEAKARRSHI